jgi:hypothetical protein
VLASRLFRIARLERIEVASHSIGGRSRGWLVVAWSWWCGGVGLTLAGCWRRWVVVKSSSQARKERDNVSEWNILGLDKAQSRDGADNVAAVFRSDWLGCAAGVDG